MTITEFLNARLAEDEQAARRACEYTDPAWRVDDDGETVLWSPPEPEVAERNRRKGLSTDADEWRGQQIETLGEWIAPHIARQDPARVLREVAAKRAMIQLAAEASGLDMSIDTDRRVGDRDTAEEPYLGNRILRHLAAVYADHPDYDAEKWTP